MKDNKNSKKRVNGGGNVVTGCHLNSEDRETIAVNLGNAGLRQREKVTRCALLTNSDPTTIRKEIKTHTLVISRNKSNHSDCALYPCDKTNLCSHCLSHNKCCFCKSNKCSEMCKDYTVIACSYRDKTPHVCNGCPRLDDGTCKLTKLVYKAHDAQKSYIKLLTVSRQVIKLDTGRRVEINELLNLLIPRGQSLFHIFHSNPEVFQGFGIQTLYNYINLGVFDIKNIDLIRKVSLAPRKQRQLRQDITPDGRRHIDDLKEEILLDAGISVVEIDTFQGIIGGEAMLTMCFRRYHVMLAFKIPNKTQASVLAVFNRLEKKLGLNLYRTLFGKLLTDNGMEFRGTELLERSCQNAVIQRGQIYYCHTYSSYEKALVETTHNLMRKFFPKGASMDYVTQEMLDLAMSHINSYRRESCNGDTPYECMERKVGKNVMELLGIHKIENNEINLTPALLKRFK